ncbi:hypothetical protein D1AOALGA4SA_10060 [Olavius algarvensis Delta 1 endosymbiont]|nr:hypothetical protein D1AOALGA4SA_10060 [Olavius algarvensis Delta 1 endosymbiont]
MPIERVLTDIPQEDIDQIVEDFESEGCTVAREKQADGLFTVRATCPDDPPAD